MLFCLGMCVKNSQVGLEYNIINNLKKLNQYFQNLQIIVAYDFSFDKSLRILNSYNDEFQNMHIYNITDMNRDLNGPYDRTKKIANARNKILEVIKTDFSECEYFAMMDTNNYSCVGDIHLSTLDYVFQNKDKWDSVSFDREAGYYDDWALSFHPFVYSFFHFEDFQHVVGLMREYRQKYIDERNDGEFISVLSAFNGFAIYKTHIFIDCSYDHKINMDLYENMDIQKQINIVNRKVLSNLDFDCEHRNFHLEALKHKNAKIFICKKSLFKKIDDDIEGIDGPA